MLKKIQIIAIIVCISLSLTVWGQNVRPNQVSGLLMWFRADSNVLLSGSTVDQWLDCSGNGYNLIQPSSSLRPLFIASDTVLNNMPVIKYDGIDDLLSTNPISNLDQNSITFIAVLNGNNIVGQPGYGGVFQIGSYPTGFWFAARPSPYDYIITFNNYDYFMTPSGSLPATGFGYKILTHIKNLNNSSSQYWNSTQIVTSIIPSSSAPLTTNGEIRLGGPINGATSQSWSGNFAEVIIYNTALSTIDRANIENYLRNKYSPPLDLGPDIQIDYGFCGVTLSATQNYSSYLWSTGETTKNIHADQAGSYWLRVTDIFGYTTSDTVNISFPMTKLNYSDTLLCPESIIQLKPIIENLQYYSFLWSDGSIDSALVTSQPGMYYLSIYDSLGCSSKSDSVRIQVDSLIGLATLGPDTSLCSGSTITVEKNGNDIIGYSWSTGTTDSSITILADGEYWVSITNTNYCSTRDTINIVLSGVAPISAFLADTVCYGDTTRFTDLSVATLPDSIVLWKWSFGDGDTADIKSPLHHYRQPGIYSVSLSVITAGGCVDRITQNILIRALPNVDFYSNLGCSTFPLFFINQSNAPAGDSILSYSWSFGDGDTSNQINPSHVYTNGGYFLVSLQIQSALGCLGEKNDTIFVASQPLFPTAFSLVTPLDGTYFLPGTVDFLWNSSNNASQYEFEIAADSTFTSMLEVIPVGQSNSFSKTIIINSKYFWRIKALSPCGDSTYSTTRNFFIYSPTSEAGLVFWLNADSNIILNTNHISTWSSIGGISYDFEQSNSSFQPIYFPSDSRINNHAAVLYDGHDDLLTGNTIASLSNSSISIFAVVSGNNIVGNPGYSGFFQVGQYPTGFWLAARPDPFDYLITFNNSDYFWTAPGSLSSGGFTYKIISHIKKINEYSSQFWNGVEIIRSNLPASSENIQANGNVRLGGSILGASSESWDGYFAEIIVFAHAIEGQNQKNIEQYLRYKYAPPVNLGPDISMPYGFCDTTLSAGPRFTHYLWSTGDTTESIAVNSGGTYAVQVMDIFGYTSTDTVIVNKPVALHVSDTMGCLGTPILMSAGLGTYYNYSWSTGDTTESITLSLPGDYWLEITDTLACSIRDTVRFAVDSFAVKATLGPDKSACRGEILGLLQGQNEAVGYAWSTGSGNAQILLNNAPQTYQDYSVTVNNALGCLAKDTIRIFVRGDVPLPAFLSDSVCPGQFTSFTDLSSAIPPEHPESWLWAFGDGDSSTLQHPTHSYASSGQYTVSLTVVTDSGCFKTLSKPVTVWGTPNVAFSPINGCNGVPVPFHDYSTNDHGTNTGWHWDFGETVPNDTSLLQHPSWTYTAPGTYTVSLIVNSNGGCIDTLQRTIDVREAPEPGFTVSQSCDGQRIFFVDTTQTHPWTETTYRKWYFGDGDSSTLVSPSHVYNTVGTYNVTLVVKSLNGCSNSITAPIAVHPVPAAGIWNTNLCATLPGQLLDSTVLTGDAIESWHWTINGLITSTQQNPMFTPATAGPVTAQLIVRSASGCSDTTTKTLTAYPLPNAAFSYDPEFGTAPLTVNFTNLSTGDASWLWDFGDSGSSTSENPEYVFFTEGIYPVTLTVVSIYGCPHSVTQDMYVIMLITDIAVVSAETVTTASTLGMQATLLNNGTRAIGSLIMKARFNGSNTISEIWNGVLAPGEMLDYQFNASFELMSGQKLDYACVEAEINGYADDRPENNLRCEVLNDIFSVSKPYPNPVSGEVALDVILPFADDVFIAVYNEAGKKMAEVFSGPAPEGYARYIFDASALQAGTYAIHVAFRDKKEVRKFVRL